MSRRAFIAATVSVFTVLAAVAAIGFVTLSRPEPTSTPNETASNTTTATGNAGDCATGDTFAYFECVTERLAATAGDDPAGAIGNYELLAEATPLLRTNCHGAFHRFGRAAFTSIGNAWSAFDVGTSGCNWGYVHGVIEGAVEHAAADIDWNDVGAEVSAICGIPAGRDDTTSDLSYQGNCLHGLGHAFVRTAPSIPVAYESCGDVGFEEVNGPKTCYDGMFMEVANSEGTELAEISELCTLAEGDVRNACFLNVGPAVMRAMSYDPDAAFSWCVESADPGSCSHGVASYYVFNSGGDIEAVFTTCRLDDTAALEGCFTGAVTSLTVAARQGVVDAVAVAEGIDRLVRPYVSFDVDEAVLRAEAGLGEDRLR